MTETLPTAEELQNEHRKMGVPAIDCPLERIAVQLLYQSGWSIPVLSMTFQASERSIKGVLNNDHNVPNPPALPEGME